MLTFQNFIMCESATSEEQLTHLYHNEEHILNHGQDGFHHAIANLKEVHNKLSGGRADKNTHITQKIDGSPSLIYGVHPHTGKRFVATKSAFNKDPKINYTEADIDKNHGHAPGLSAKLKLALKHLPKVMPKHGVYQGDVLHSHDDKHDDGTHISFKPNTITYGIHKDHPDYAKAKESKFGIAFHTKYEGTPTSDHHIGGMFATFNVDHNKFKQHKDVHLVSPEVDASKMKYSDKQKSKVDEKLKKAEDLHSSIKPEEYAAVQHHDAHLRKYYNAKVRDGGTPSVDDYHSSVGKALNTEADKMKSEKGKAAKKEVAAAFTTHVNNHKEAFKKVMKLHDHLQGAKDELVNALSSHQDYKHTVNGKEVKPEGFVVIRHGRPSKLVDRQEFSKMNFENNRGRVAPSEEETK